MDNRDHFNGRDALGHIAEVYAQGRISSNEIHGPETPGKILAFSDALRDCSIILLLSWVLFKESGLISEVAFIPLLILFGLSLSIWKIGRSAWLGWSRLERMHRIAEQERWEIEHRRPQEREELKALYGAKGFEGKLLEDVLDVLMADGDRLLRVMVQEELGLSLEAYDHPLLQAFGAAVGSLSALVVAAAGYLLYPDTGVFIASVFSLSAGSWVNARYTGNQILPAIVWNLGLLVLSAGTLYFLIDYTFPL